MLWCLYLQLFEKLVSQQLELPFFSAWLRLRTFYFVEDTMHYSFLDYQDLLFRADFSDSRIDAHADEAHLLERAWEHIEAELALPKYQKICQFTVLRMQACYSSPRGNRICILLFFGFAFDFLARQLAAFLQLQIDGIHVFGRAANQFFIQSFLAKSTFRYFFF